MHYPSPVSEPVDVLVDLTPLDTFSRYRGVGKVTAALGKALATLPESERGGLRIGGLCALGGEHALGPVDWPGPKEPSISEEEEIPWLNQRRTLLVKTLWQLRPRLFHATQNLGTPRGAPTPRVVTCHDLIRLVMHEDYLPGRWAYRRLLYATEMARFHGARRVIAISQYTADELMRLMSVPASRIDVVQWAVDHERFRAAPADEGEEQASLQRLVGHNGPYFVYLGGVDPRKGMQPLLQAFAQAKTADAELLLVGRLPPDRAKLVDQAMTLAGNPKHVRRLGYVEDVDVPVLLRGAQAMAFPSRYEGFGLPVLEAMACGCPVVTTAETSLKEVAGDAALLVDPHDVDGLAHSLERLLGEPALRADLQRAGLKRAAGFSWAQCARETVQVYQRALEN